MKNKHSNGVRKALRTPHGGFRLSKNANLFSSLVAGATLLVGAVYFIGWSYRYTYYSLFSIPSVVPEFNPISFFGLTFNLLCGSFFMKRFQSGDAYGSAFSTLMFFLGPLIVVVAVILIGELLKKSMFYVLNRLVEVQRYFRKIELNGRNTQLALVNTIAFLFMNGTLQVARYAITILLSMWSVMRDIAAALSILVILYILASQRAIGDFNRDVLESTSKLYKVSVLVKADAQSLTAPIYTVLNDINAATNNQYPMVRCVGCCPDGASREAQTSWRLLLRLNDNLYLVRTLPNLSGGSAQVSTVIFPRNEDNKDYLILVKQSYAD